MREDRWGKGMFVVVLVFYLVLVAGTLLFMGLQKRVDDSAFDKGLASMEVRQASDGTIITSTTYYSSTAPSNLGAFDPALGQVRSYAIGLAIALISAIIGAALLLIYGAFYVNNSKDANSPLGLPRDTVRVFVMIIIAFSILVFAFLPSSWTDSRAVSFLLGLLSTVVGFYYGTQGNEGGNKSGREKPKQEPGKLNGPTG
jgi:hypothetical protein